MSARQAIQLNNVTKKFKKTTVIDEMNLQINEGEFLVLLGPSGCGKSTMLRLIAGLEKANSGEILINGQDIKQDSYFANNFAMVFQDYALYPNMTVYQNLEYALKVHKVPKRERQTRLNKVLNMLNLTAYQDRLPGQLSGGQKQRVALGRGMVKKSNIFLLDEPLSNIDVQLREKARDEIKSMHDTSHQTIVYVTHDQLEAMSLGDRIAIMNNGVIQMIDTPNNIYNNPINLFVAEFVGVPQINTLTGEIIDGQVYFAGYSLIADYSRLNKLGLISGNIYIGIRPENIHVSEQPQNAASIPVIVDKIVDYGRYQELMLIIANGQLIKATTTNNQFVIEDNVYATLVDKKILLFNQQTKQNIEYSLEN
ncbi:sugar ABC transporter ATP-binding protein [Leuconostoc litchii]|uniref:ABC transporter ATP-binding protein n=1 Tax=Leuconostoc litchii TaxID=1981069 RepID=A0A6P2CR66_9LACO|nr:ABC transporter ATP-binding protein [Leuconostoc litchii]TYC47602.1 ABC transporter ATP-binding protein [Leuconostoc litchii]GMA69647.1 sugar ABC transporter ATP-binding protein [Leuconostoc litchii]